MRYKDLDDYELVYRIRENDVEAENVMISKYENVLSKLARKYLGIAESNGAELDDLIQEGRIALINAVRTFDFEKELLFYTYVCVCVERHCISYCRSLASKKYSPLNYSLTDDSFTYVRDSSYEPGYRLDDFIYENNFLSYIRNNFEIIDSSILELRYNGFSYKEISELLDLPISKVDNRLCKMRRILQVNKSKFN